MSLVLSAKTLLLSSNIETAGSFCRTRFLSYDDMETYIKSFFDAENAGDQSTLDTISSHFSSYDLTRSVYDAGYTSTAIGYIGEASGAFGSSYLGNYSTLSKKTAEIVKALKMANPELTSKEALNMFNKAGSQASAAFKASMGISIGLAAIEVALSDNPDYTGIQIGAGISSSLIASNLTNSLVVAIAMGAGASTATAALLGAAVAGLAAVAAYAAWQAYGDDITNALYHAKELGVDAVQAAIQAYENFEEDLSDFFENISFDDVLDSLDAAMTGIATEAENLAEFVEDVIAKFGSAMLNASPLIIDLDGDGIELISLENSLTRFDLTEDGFAERTSWVSTDDAILAIDLNGNGEIDDSSELFGSVDTDGFTQLAALDSNGDGVIDAQDACWNDLILWRDLDLSGTASEDELFTMSDYDIVSIDLNATEISETNEGNEVTHESTVTFSDSTVADIVDVWFNYDSTDTVYVGDYTADFDSVVLINRGYGTIPALHIATCIDNDTTDPDSLISLVTDLSTLTLSDLFTDDDTTMGLITEIIYRWAGVDGVDPDSRGPNIDARVLEFLEEMVGQEFEQTGSSGQSDPGYWAAQNLIEAFYVAQQNIYARLVAQSAGAALFEGDFYYNISTDSLDGVTGLNYDTIDALEALGLTMSSPDVFWQNVVKVIEYTVGVNSLESADQTYLNDAIYATDNTLTLTEIVDSLTYDTPDGDTYTGTSGDDSITAGVGDDEISGDDGNDTMYGGIGADTIYGEAGDDVLWGESGSDYLLGGLGNDTYYWSAGHGDDIIKEYGSGTGNDADEIVLGSGYDLADLTITRTGNTGLLIEIDNGTSSGSILIEDFCNYPATGGHVESIRFADNSTYDLDGQDLTLIGSDDDDCFFGVLSGVSGTGVDTIYGGAGNDTIFGYASGESDYNSNWLYGENGEDILYGSYGDDYLYGGNGDDELRGGAGDDYIDFGAGDDFSYDTYGDDTYFYVSGNDTIYDLSGTDSIVLDASWDGASPLYNKIDNDLVIWFDLENSINVSNYFTTCEVETMEFDNGTTVTLSGVTYKVQGTSGNDYLSGTSNTDVLWGFDGNDNLYASSSDDILYGGAGNDKLTAGYGNDYLDGGAGNDYLKGESGDDTYYYVSGYDWIYDTTGSDTLKLVYGYNADDLTFRRYTDGTQLYDYDSNDLVIELKDSSVNSIVICNFFCSDDQVETIEFSDGSTMTLTGLQYETHGTNGDDYLFGITYGGSINDIMYGWDGDDTIYGGYGDDILYGGAGNDEITGKYGNDYLSGGAGNDYLKGENGDDTYYYVSGYDWIYDSTGNDTLELTSGYDAEDLTFRCYTDGIQLYDYDSNDLVIELKDSSVNSIVICNFFCSDDQVETIEFSDGSTMTLTGRQYETHGTDGDDYLFGITYGGSINDIMYSWDGDDTAYGGYGDDVIYGGIGADTLEGDYGNDTLYGEEGNDILKGEAYNDILYGGAGADTLYGGTGSDTFVFEENTAFDAVDTIEDFLASQGDVIDISDILSGYDPLTDDINDFVMIGENSSDSYIHVDTDGEGTNEVFHQILTIDGVTGLGTIEELISSGQLAVA